VIFLGGDKEAIEVTASDRFVKLASWHGDKWVTIYLDQNHAEALETALRAARLELQARAVSA
jgi:hypothetical protein